MNYEKLLLLFVLVFLPADLATALKCMDTGRFETNSSFAEIRETALKSLASNVTARGYYNTNLTSRDGRKMIHALALCREGYDPQECSNCVSKAAGIILQTCSDNTEAYSWEEDGPCFVRYSDRPMLGYLRLDPAKFSPSKESLTINLTRFDGIWDPSMHRTLNRASSSSSRLRCAAEKVEYNPGEYIYAFMQCTPDLSARECYYCLRLFHGYYKSCCHGLRGGTIETPSCFYRWNLYPYSKAFDHIEAVPLSSERDNKGSGSIPFGTFSTLIIIIVLAFVFLIALIATTFAFLWRRRISGEPSENEVAASFRLDFSTVRYATGGFSTANKLGQGGFGSVYWGQLRDGKDVAVKRLSGDSGQGELEFKNEVTLLAKVQHRNLVKLLGYCLERNERILLYEYVPKSSLDRLIADPDKRAMLTWDVRFNIIEGTARGLQYLHEDSALRIIHRDLKSSNILLDSEMRPKISDFGLARILTKDQTRAETSKVVGTYGYMPPEYIMHGRFSVRSDVYSFGVVILEVISGQISSSFHGEDESESLVAYAWRSWCEGKPLNLVDPILDSNCNGAVAKCIQIGLLCVQEDITRRPRMNTVVHWLNADVNSLPPPSKSAFLWQGGVPEAEGTSTTTTNQESLNSVSITTLDAR